MRSPRSLSQEHYEQLLIEQRDDGVAVVSLNRPERLNAMTATMHAEIAELPLDIAADRSVRAVVLTGAGRSFCSGADVESRLGDGEDTMSPFDVMGEPREIIDRFLDLETPVITAVRGHAYGFGCTLALLGDVVLAGQSARFGDLHVTMGLTAGDGGAVLWPLLVGIQRAKYYLMTGERVPADEAERIGLVHRVVEDDELVPEALALASRLAAGPPIAVRSTKSSINRYVKMVSNQVLPYSLAIEGLSMTSDDHQEAVRAFTERRDPRFEGR